MGLKIEIDCCKCGHVGKWPLRQGQDINESKVKDAHRYLQFYTLPEDNYLCFECAINLLDSLVVETGEPSKKET